MGLTLPGGTRRAERTGGTLHGRWGRVEMFPLDRLPDMLYGALGALDLARPVLDWVTGYRRIFGFGQNDEFKTHGPAVGERMGQFAVEQELIGGIGDLVLIPRPTACFEIGQNHRVASINKQVQP